MNYKPRNTLAPENMVKILDFVHKPCNSHKKALMQRRLNYTMCLGQRTVSPVALKVQNLSKKVLKVMYRIKLKNCERVSNPLLYVLLMFVGLCYCLKCHSGAN